MADLESRILAAITSRPGQKAGQIAVSLGVDKRLVNSALYGSLKGRVRQDKDYRWHPNRPSPPRPPEEEPPKPPNTPLAKLCRYYLDCLSHDDLDGVSEFASSYGQLSYVEIQSLPMLDATDASPFDSDGGRTLLNTLRRDRERKALFVGYPVRLNSFHSRKDGREYFKVEPLLLFPFTESDARTGPPTLSDESPQINLSSLRSLSHTGEASVMEEAILLAEELGLGVVPGDPPTWMNCVHGYAIFGQTGIGVRRSIRLP